MSLNTEIEIGFFKPTGFADRWIVPGDDRGAAVQAVLDWYKENQPQPLPCLNFINARLTSAEPNFPPQKIIQIPSFFVA